MLASLSEITVLVVEDQPSVLDLLTATLRMLGVGKVFEVNNAAKAKQLIRTSGSRNVTGKGTINVVMIDVVLSDGGEEGFQLVEWIREHKESPNRFVPIMMFSALASLSTVQRSRDMGINVFMRKPFAVNSVANLLLSLIRDQRNFIETEEYFGPDRRRPQAQELKPENEQRKGAKGVKIFEFDIKKNTSYALSQNAINRAERQFKRKTEIALLDLDQQMNKIVTMSKQLGNASRGQVTPQQPESIDTLANSILDRVILVRMNLGVFRMPILFELSKGLSEFICQMMDRPREYVNEDSIRIADRFISFMKISIKYYEKFDDTSGKAVLNELTQVRERFQTKYIPESLSMAEVDERIDQSMKRIRDSEELKKLLC